MPNMTRDEIRHFRKLGAEFRRQVNERRMKDDSLELAEILSHQWAREELENADTESPGEVEPCPMTLRSNQLGNALRRVL